MKANYKNKNMLVLNRKFNRIAIYVILYILLIFIATNLAITVVTAERKDTTEFLECYVDDIIEDDNTITYKIIEAVDNNKELVELQLNKKVGLGDDESLTELKELSKLSVGDYFMCSVKTHYSYKKLFWKVFEKETSHITKVGIYLYPEQQLKNIYKLMNE